MQRIKDPEPGTSPDECREARDAAGEILAQCALWWRDPLVVDGHAAGLIGQYDATSAAAGVDVLLQACLALRERGCTLAIGPMDGSTWGGYRMVTGGTDEPPFFLEPAHPRGWAVHFETAGFSTLARYYSTVTEDLDTPDAKTDRAEIRLRDLGYVIRTLDLSRLEREVESIFHISQAAFRKAFLYRPIPFDAFAATQKRLASLLRPELVMMAARAGEPVGFVFAIPDLEQARRGVPVDTVIIKTLAVLPRRELAGLGVCLVRRLHRAARSLGFRRVIHALMHEANNALNIHRPSSLPLREYSLFAKPL